MVAAIMTQERWLVKQTLSRNGSERRSRDPTINSTFHLMTIAGFGVPTYENTRRMPLSSNTSPDGDGMARSPGREIGRKALRHSVSHPLLDGDYMLQSQRYLFELLHDVNISTRSTRRLLVVEIPVNIQPPHIREGEECYNLRGFLGSLLVYPCGRRRCGKKGAE